MQLVDAQIRVLALLLLSLNIGIMMSIESPQTLREGCVVLWVSLFKSKIDFSTPLTDL